MQNEAAPQAVRDADAKQKRLGALSTVEAKMRSNATFL